MRVLMVSWAWRSHYFPLVSLGWALRSAGHEVLVATQPALVDVVVGSGLPAASVGHDIDIAEVIRRAVGRLEPARPDRAWWDAVTAKMRECLGIFLTPAEAMADDTVALAERWRPDLVVYEPSSYVGPLVAGVLGVPAVRHLWGPDVFGRFAGLEQENLAPLAHRFGLTTIDPIGDLTIDPCPPSLQLPGDYRRQIVRYIPYNGPALSPEWLADAPAAPRVCVTGGTSSVVLGGQDLDMVPLVAEALDGLDLDVVFAVPPADGEGLPRRPNVRVVHGVPLHLLLPSCALLIHQGGAGTTLTAVSHGVPQLIVAQLPEMLINARQIGKSGAGEYLFRSQTSPEQIREWVVKLLDDPSYGQAARRLGEETARQTPPACAISVLEEMAARAVGEP